MPAPVTFKHILCNWLAKACRDRIDAGTASAEQEKVHVGSDTKLTYKVVDGTEYIETVMPYSVDEFKKITKKALPALHQGTPEGFMVGMYINGNKNS